MLKRLPGVRYVAIDLTSGAVNARADIGHLGIADNTFDAVISNHVLEHVEDDARAMRELARVLRPEGWAVLQVPIDLDRERTFEDWTICDPEAREAAFGQHDHVRVYGRDYKDRLEMAGFEVAVDGYAQSLGPCAVRRYGLLPTEDIYICTKPVAGPRVAACTSVRDTGL
jgi:SAM-dependent methyltransferase